LLLSMVADVNNLARERVDQQPTREAPNRNLFLARYTPRVDILALIRRAAKLRERRRGAFDEADAELRRLIREGFESGIPGEQLAKAAGLSVPRIYQIRDGRR
jgi:hypothetical protein